MIILSLLTIVYISLNQMQSLYTVSKKTLPVLSTVAWSTILQKGNKPKYLSFYQND